MIIRSYASSSKGNCYLISDGKTKLLLECGIPFSRIKQEVGLSFDACLITHEHKDHSRSLVDLIHHCKKVYATQGTFDAQQNLNPFENYCNVVEKNKMVVIGSFKIIPFETKHDAAEPVGFYIKSENTNETLLFATDTYYIPNKFEKINYLMIECNYSEKILLANLKFERLTKTQFERIKRSHFEFENVKKFIKSQNMAELKEIYLLHLSKNNSNANEFQKEIQTITGVPVWVCPE